MCYINNIPLSIINSSAKLGELFGLKSVIAMAFKVLTFLYLTIIVKA